MTLGDFYKLTEAQIFYLAEAARHINLARDEFRAALHGVKLKKPIEPPKLSQGEAAEVRAAGDRIFAERFGRA